MPKLQNLDSANLSDLVHDETGVPHRRRPLSAEKQSVPSIHQSPPPPQVATFSPPLGQFFINALLQIAGFVAAIAFGIYAVKSVTVGNSANQYANQAVQQAVTANQFANQAVQQAMTANQLANQAVLQAVTANQLAILAMCLSSGNQVGHVEPLSIQKGNSLKLFAIF